jgi:hypothetical protein
VLTNVTVANNAYPGTAAVSNVPAGVAAYDNATLT